jgi:hypothetical protein
MNTTPARAPSSLSLEHPMSLGVYDTSAEAQRVVDHLSDRAFPVEHVVIVGTELKSVERVTGRLTRRRTAIAGTISGAWMGLFVGIAFALFSNDGRLGFLVTTPLLGAVFGLIWSQLGFVAATRGSARDFASVGQILATKYEVLVEQNLVALAHDLAGGFRR